MNTATTTSIVGALIAIFFGANSLMAQQVGATKPHNGSKDPIKVFILAEQSNMEGQGVVSMDGEKDYNGGKGNLVWSMANSKSAGKMKCLKDDMFDFRKAQEEGTRKIKNARFIKTAGFARAPELSPNPGHGHHWSGNAESYFLVGDALGNGMKNLLK